MNIKKTSSTSIFLRLAAVLFALVLITSWQTSGLFARYTSNASATSTAKVAKFGGGEVIFNSETVPKVENAEGGIYAFPAYVTVDFSNNEVTSTYSLTLSLSGNATSAFSTSSTTVYTITVDEDGIGQFNSTPTPNSLLGITGSSFTANKIYAAVCMTSADGSYEALNVTYNGDGSVTLAQNVRAESGAVHYYKLLVFTTITANTVPDSYTVNFELSCVQVD